jgi:hypothetical protein
MENSEQPHKCVFRERIVSSQACSKRPVNTYRRTVGIGVRLLISALVVPGGLHFPQHGKRRKTNRQQAQCLPILGLIDLE